MSAANQIRLGLVLAFGFIGTGCGPSAPSPLGASKPQAPRRIELPANILPLLPDRSTSDMDAEAGSIRVQYQQPQPPTNSRPPYNVELAAAPQSGDASRVREPLPTPPPVVNDAPATPPMRSQFVPIDMPQQSTAPASQPSPSLPASATFVATAPVRAEPSSGQPINEGPQLTAPFSAAPSLSQADQAAAQSSPQPESARPQPERWTSAPVAPAALPESRDRRAAPPSPPATQQVAVYNAPVAIPQQPVTAQQPPRSSALQAIEQRALQMADHASATAQRGMFFSARNELLQGLQLISQALDVQEGNAHHAAALAAGLTALEEARDFAITSNRPGNAVNAGGIAANHRTPLLRDLASTISPVVAQQQYFGYAQSQFVLATGGVPAASQILYRLGRLQSAMAAHDPDPLALHAPQSIVFHQAALATDSGNWLAANELGVLYARYGQLGEARQLLVYSVTVHPHVEGWHNLAVVHRRLGESDLAERAENERLQLAQRTVKSANKAGDMVNWVDPKTFAASSSRDGQGPDQRYAVAPATASTAPARR